MPQVLKFTPEQVSAVTLESLKLRSRLARVVNTRISGDFVPGVGSSVTIKAPAVLDRAGKYTAAMRSAGEKIKYSSFVQPTTSIKLTDQVYEALMLTDEVLTFDIKNLASEVIAPMVEGVADGINRDIAAVLEKTPAGLTAIDKAEREKFVTDKGNSFNSVDEAVAAGERIVGSGAKVTVKATDLQAKTHADVRKVIRYAHRLLNERGVPASARYLIVGASWAQALQADQSLTKVSEAGESDLLRESTIGRLSGFTIIEEPGIDPNSAYAMHADAIAAAIVAPALPQGASFAAHADGGGFRVRYLHDYDPDTLQDRAVVSTFVGAEILDPQRVVKLTGTAGFEEPAAAAGTGGE